VQSPLFAVGQCLLAVSLAACVPKATPCQTPGDCSSGHECLAFRCVPEGGTPVPEGGERRVLWPTLVASPSAKELPASVTLGAPHHGRLYLDFELPALRCEHLNAAFLLLDPETPGQASAGSVALSVRRVLSAWTPEDVGSGVLPRDGLPEAQGLAHAPLTARIDISRLICHELDTPIPGYGLVVRAEDDDAALRLSTGLASGSGPRVELYLKPQ
jgi:hypothetical protein